MTDAANNNNAGNNADDEQNQGNNANSGSDGSGNGEGNNANNGNSQNSSNTDGNGANDGNGERTFTQVEVNKMMTREKKQGRNSAFNELGIDPDDTKMINAFKAFKAAYEGDSDDGGADASAVEDAEMRAMVAEMKYEAVAAGVQPQYVDDAVTLAIARTTDDTDAKTIIGEFRTKYPAWFKDDEGDDKGKNTGQNGTGSSIKNNGAGSNDDKNKPGLGARLAAQRKGSGTKKSYWS